jgi:hypothetical protein
MGSNPRWRRSVHRPLRRTLTKGLSRVLDSAEDASPLQAVEAVTAELSAALEASAAFFMIADISGRGLVRLSQASADLPVAGGGLAGESLRTQTVQVLPPGGRGREGRPWEVLAPVTERGEALGLLQVSLPREPNAAVLSEVSGVAHVLSFVVIANRRHTDLFEWAQRSVLFTLPAEIQRRTAALGFAVVLAAVVQAVAGDAVDAGSLTTPMWVAAVGSGVLHYGLAFWFYLTGLRRVSTSVAGSFITLVPVFGVAAGYLAGERLTGRQWVGAAVVIIAIVAVAVRQNRPDQAPARPHVSPP